MDHLAALIAVIAPVFLVSSVGFIWGRLQQPFDHSFVTKIVTNVGAPALVFVTLVQSPFPLADLGRMGAASLSCLIVFAVVAGLGLHLAGLSQRIFLPSLVFPNIGNMGLPVCLYAFGPRGLALAMINFTVVTICQFSFGPAIAQGEISLGRLLRVPFLYAAILAVGAAQIGVAVPQWLLNTLTLIGNVTIPLMLMGLGAALSQFAARDKKRQFILSAARIGLGLGGSFAVATAFGLTGAERGVIIIQGAMPTAVFNYLFARMYDNDPDEIAGLVLLSTLLGYLCLPFILALAM